MAAPPVLGGPLRPQDTRERARIINLVVDDLEANTISGITIRAGVRFDDTLGSFYPIVLTPADGIIINASNANSAALTFHNTASSMTDELIYLSDAGNLVVTPDSTSSVARPLLVIDRNSSTYSGLSIAPSSWSISAITNAGTGNASLDLRAQNDGDILMGAQKANYVGIRGVASGSQPFLQAYGTSDANVDFLIQPKGSGVLALGYSLTTMGGGAAPTLGTIGGSGPATATQHSWLKLKSGTSAFFVPVWV